MFFCYDSKITIQFSAASISSFLHFLLLLLRQCNLACSRSYCTFVMVTNTFQNLHTANIVSCTKKKKCIQPNSYSTLNKLTANFQEQSCTCLIEILPLEHAVEFWASLTDNSMAFSIFKLGDPPWQLTFFISSRLKYILAFFSAGARRFLAGHVCLPSLVGSLLSSGSELVEGTCLEL